MKNIAVFGGSSPQPGDDAYQQAYDLGKKLGAIQATVITGGYMGTMEAVSRGTVEGGGHTIGITCDEIESWRKRRPNIWIQEEIRCNTLIERISTMITSSDAAITLPGGIGTLTEMALLWNQLVIHTLSPRPFILLGPVWEAIVMKFYESSKDYVSQQQLKWITFSQDENDSVRILDDWFTGKSHQLANK
jgi:uncharacterized protein (TIGR00730 family)